MPPRSQEPAHEVERGLIRDVIVRQHPAVLEFTELTDNPINLNRLIINPVRLFWVGMSYYFTRREPMDPTGFQVARDCVPARAGCFFCQLR